VEQDDITGRKADHLRLAIDTDVEAPLGGGGAFDAIRLVHRALPGIDRADVDPTVDFLGKRLAFPLMVGSMTGGTDEAGTINRRLAEACARVGVGMFLGSQRVMLERPETAPTFRIREVAPAIPLVANIGAVQLNYGVTAAHIGHLVESVGADGVVFHVNAAQEAVQPEGDTDFSGLVDGMAGVVDALGPIPVGVKEVGAGFDIETVRALTRVPFAFIESAGRGGTSWTLIEGKRAPADASRRLGALFADWGIPTVTSLLTCVRYGGGVPVIASGGLRTGLDGARAVAAGASLTAMALPLLRAAARSVEDAVCELELFRDAFCTAMFLVGARTVEDLRRARVRIDPAALPEAYEGLDA